MPCGGTEHLILRDLGFAVFYTSHRVLIPTAVCFLHLMWEDERKATSGKRVRLSAESPLTSLQGWWDKNVAPLATHVGIPLEKNCFVPFRACWPFSLRMIFQPCWQGWHVLFLYSTSLTCGFLISWILLLIVSWDSPTQGQSCPFQEACYLSPSSHYPSTEPFKQFAVAFL